MRTRPRLSYANIMSTIAVFITLGGVSYAATALPKNSVGAGQIKKNAVNSKKVKDGSLLGKDFKPGQLPAGPMGKQGPQGRSGPGGATNATVIAATKSGGGGGVVSAHAKCPAGWRATGGGVGSEYGQGQIQQNGPVDDAANFLEMKSGEAATGWYGRIGGVTHNPFGPAQDLYVYAICSPA